MAGAGFTPEDYAEDDVAVWPENWLAWRLFSSLSTQWLHVSVGMDRAVRTGLHYPSLYPLLDRECADPESWQQTFHDVQVCEDAALAQMKNNR